MVIDISKGMKEYLREIAHEEAYITACELVGLNSPEFEELFEELSASLFEKYHKEHIEALQELVNESGPTVPIG